MNVSPSLATNKYVPQSEKMKVKIYAYTFLVYALIGVLLFLQWVESPPIKEMQEDVMEVNLGNVESALGDEIPEASQSSGEATQQAVATPPPSSTAPAPTSTATPSEPISSDDPDIAAMLKKETATPKPKVQPNTQPKPQTNVTPNPIKPAPQPPAKEVERKPLAVFGGANEDDNGTSNYDSYGKNNASQGIGQGTGDMGSVGGSVNSDNYSPSMSVVSGLGKRKVLANPPIDRDFSSEGVVQIQATFGKDGRFISAQQDIKNSTTTQRQLVNIALEQVKKIRLNEDPNSAYEQAVTFRFVFKLKL